LFGYIPSSGIARTYGSFTFDTFRNLHIFHHYMLNSYSINSVQGFSSPWRQLCLVMLTIAFLSGVMWCVIVAVIYISMISNLKHFSWTCSLFVSSLEKCLLTSIAHFLLNLLVFCSWCLGVPYSGYQLHINSSKRNSILILQRIIALPICPLSLYLNYK
jgi:hypothetical protein